MIKNCDIRLIYTLNKKEKLLSKFTSNVLGSQPVTRETHLSLITTFKPLLDASMTA